jgi:hypothetical protein
MLAGSRHLRLLNSSSSQKNLVQALANNYQAISSRNKNTFIAREHFERRHNGISPSEQEEMLKFIKVKVS